MAFSQRLSHRTAGEDPRVAQLDPAWEAGPDKQQMPSSKSKARCQAASQRPGCVTHPLASISQLWLEHVFDSFQRAMSRLWEAKNDSMIPRFPMTELIPGLAPPFQDGCGCDIW